MANLAIGADLGTSTLKISFSGKKILVPSIIGETNPGWQGGTLDKSLEKNLVVIDGQDQWYVGELARLQSEVKRGLVTEGQMKSAEETFIALRAVLSLAVENDGETILLATGVPVATSLEVMKNLSRMLKGNIEIHVKNDATGQEKRLTVNIEKVLVLPEPYGTYYKVLKDKGEEEAVDTVIIDIGHGTTDILTMYQGRPMRTASGSLVEATDTLTNRIAAKLTEQTNQIVRPYDLMETIKRQKETVMLGGQTYSIKSVKDYYAKQISKVLVDEVVRLVSTLPPDAFVEYYIITGGGAYIFGDALRDAILARKLVAVPDHVIIPDDPVMSNAQGFELVAKSQK